MKGIIEKIGYSKSSLLTIGLVLIGCIFGLIIARSTNEIVKVIGMLIFVISILSGIITGYIRLLKKDRGYIIILVIGIIILASVGIIKWFGDFMTSVIPKWYPDNKDYMYQLFTTGFGSVITALMGLLSAWIGAFYGGNMAKENMNEQLKYREKEQDIKDKENRETIIRIICKFLKEEIIENKNKIEKTQYFAYLNKGYGTQYGHRFNEEIRFESYDRIKYELVKYYDVKIVEDVIDLYELFYLLARYSDINLLNEKEYSKMCNLKHKINHVLMSIDRLNIHSDKEI